MVNKQMFRTAFSGFDKESVIKYLTELEAQNEADIKELNDRIAELESTAAKQHNQIKTKNDEIEKLIGELEVSRKRAVGKLGEMSELVDEMGKNERDLRKDFDVKEADYKAKILELEKTLENNQATFAKGKSLLADARVKADKMLEDAQIKCEDMKDRCDKEIAVYREKRMAEVDEETELRRNDVKAAEQQLRNILNELSGEKEKLVKEYDRVMQSVKELMC